jgi:hypothetical protein
LGFSQLTALADLQQLTLLDIVLGEGRPAESSYVRDSPHWRALAGTIGQLQQLSELSFGGWDHSYHRMGADAAAELSKLTQLQRLELHSVGEPAQGTLPSDPVLLRMLPVSLTALQCTSCCIHGDAPELRRLQPHQEMMRQSWFPNADSIQQEAAQQLGQISSFQFNALRSLQLQDTYFTPKLLLQMPQLHSVSIVFGSRELRNRDELPPKDIPMRALLAQLCDVLPQLQQLRELSLFGIMPRLQSRREAAEAAVLAAHMQQALDVPAPQQPAADCVNYAGLTASSRLTCLRIESCSLIEGAAATAAAAVQQMFGAGQQLPHLHTMLVAASPLPELEVSPSQTVSHSRYPDEGYQDLFEEDVKHMPKHSLVLGPGDAARIVQCCPNLRSLGALVVGEGVVVSELAPLLLLTQLTCLGIAGGGCDDAVAGRVLARMSGGQHGEFCGGWLLGWHVYHSPSGEGCGG